MPEILYSSIFGALTQHVQARFDAASKLHKQLFDNVIFERFLDWDTPTIGLDFEEIIGQYNITVAAPTIGDQSKEAILGTEGLETVKERILNHAVTLPMTIQDYRKVLQILDSKSLPDKAKTEQLIKLMWGSSTTVVSSVLAKLDILFLRPLSNEGIVELDDNINPEGGVRGTINFNQPAENIASSKTPWTDANLDTVDCFEDVQGIIDAAQDKTVFGKILCAPSRISYMCRSKKIKQMIWGTDEICEDRATERPERLYAGEQLPCFRAYPPSGSHSERQTPRPLYAVEREEHGFHSRRQARHRQKRMGEQRAETGGRSSVLQLRAYPRLAMGRGRNAG